MATLIYWLRPPSASSGGGGITGSLAATESGADTFAASGGPIVEGALAATEAGADTFAAAGGPIVSGALAASESGADTFAGFGGPIVSGELAAAESGSDAFAASGAVTDGPTGSLDATESGSDTFEASGSVSGEQPLLGGGAASAARSTRAHRYRVRVGRRWIEVDPLDAASVRAAYALAEQAAHEAAQTREAAPKRSAGRVVAVAPARVAGVDYVALRDEAHRISEQVRRVYAEAMQRELIGRLLRERIERDDEDDIELLLTVM